MSISFAPELGDAVREAAERAGMPSWQEAVLGGGEQRAGDRLLT